MQGKLVFSGRALVFLSLVCFCVFRRGQVVARFVGVQPRLCSLAIHLFTFLAVFPRCACFWL